MAKKAPYQVPFDSNGNLLSSDNDPEVATLVPTYTFSATLVLVELDKWRGRYQFIFADEKGRRYNMFMSDAYEMYSKVNSYGGKITGNWTFSKKGGLFGVKLLSQEKKS